MQNEIATKIGNQVIKSPLIIGANDSVINFATFERIAQSSKYLGGFITKSFTLDSRTGNKDPIISCLENNIMVSSGMRNPGFQQMLSDINQYNKKYSTPLLIASIAINPDSKNLFPEKELTDIALKLFENGVTVIELNLSCPNLNSATIVADKNGMVYKIISYMKNEFDKRNYNCTLIAKLAGDDNSLLNSSIQAEEAGIDFITILPLLRSTGFYTGLINSDTSLEIGDPLLGNKHGTIYGGGFGPITRQYLINLKRKIKTPIIASGGCLGGFNSSIIEKADGLIQTMFAGAIATEVVTPFYPFDQEKLLEIDKVMIEYQKFINNNSVKFQQIINNAKV